MEANIAKDLIPLAYPVKKLKLLPGNPNRGNVDAVAALYKSVGQRKPIVARHDEDGNEYVIAGNTQFLAVRDVLKWDKVAVSWADDLDDKQAIAYVLGDNKTARMGEMDDEAEQALLQKIADQDDLVIASGYELDFIIPVEEMSLPGLDGSLEDEDEDDEPSPTLKPERQPGNPVIQYAIVFEDEGQQQRWFAFIRWLKSTYTDLDTVAGRLDTFLDGIVPKED